MKLTLFFVLLVLVCVPQIVYGAKILFMSPIPTLSHEKMPKELWTALARKGHQVYVVTSNPVFNSSDVNLTEYDISGMYEFRKTQVKPEWEKAIFQRHTTLKSFVRHFILNTVFGKGLDYLYQHSEVKRLLAEHDHFDVCIIEWFHPALAVYGHLFKCPTIGIGTNTLPIQMLDAVGNPSHPIAAPDQDLPFRRNEITFPQRVWSVCWALFARFFHKFYVLPTEDARIKKYFGDGIPPMKQLQNNLSLILLNRNTAFLRPVANVPAIVELYMKYDKPRKQMDRELQILLDNAHQGVIYLSFGTTMHGTIIDRQFMEILQRTFEQLPYIVLWKWENSTMINKPNNVFIRNLFPQTDVLEHPNVKLFITQGGLQSIEETISAHKPIIGIPFHSDQTTNIDTCVMYGIGKMLDVDYISEKILKENIVEVVTNTSYSKNAKKLDILMKDQPEDGLQKGIWWIEYVIRHKGARHLRGIAADMPWWQYLMLDVLLFVSFIVICVPVAIYIFLKKCYKLFVIIDTKKLKDE